MKKNILRIVIFIIAFVGTYMALSFGVPSLTLSEIKDPANAFSETMRHMAGTKFLYSAAIAFFLSYAPMALESYKSNKSTKPAAKKKH